jgi:outer membrane protein assembly factor BamE (lipoprotein component of BamABCDE complex)
MFMRYAAWILIALLASACAVQSVRPGAPEAEVLQAMGRPALELRDPDGTRHLAYPTGPFGLQTHMVRIGADGRVRSVEQVLDDGRFYAINPGMTSEELLRHIGPPGERARFANLRQTAWDYRYRDTWGYIAILSVMIDDSGRVASRITRRIERDSRLF